MLILENLLCLMLSFSILGISVLAKKRVGTFLNPVSIFSGFWFFYIFFPIVVVWNINLNVIPVFYIFLFNFLFFLPVYFYKWNSITSKKCSGIYIDIKAYHFLVVISIIAVACLTIDIYIQGLSGLSFFEIGATYSGKRYENGLDGNIYAKIGNSLGLICAIWGGVVAAHFDKKNKFLIFILSFTPSVFMMLLQSAKGGFFLSFSLFMGAFLTERLRIGFLSISLAKIFGWKKILIGVGLTSVAVLSSFLSRGGYEMDWGDKLIFLKYNVASYSSGHLYAFSDWFVNYFDLGKSHFDYSLNSKLPPGYYTFTSFYNIFGISYEMPLGVFDEFFDIPDIVTTNIYTVFRGMILDFTLVGSLFLSFFLGNLFVYFYRMFLMSGAIIPALLLVYFFAFTYQSFIISSLTWVTIPFSFFVMYGIYWVFSIKGRLWL